MNSYDDYKTFSIFLGIQKVNVFFFICGILSPVNMDIVVLNIITTKYRNIDTPKNCNYPLEGNTCCKISGVLLN